MDAVLLAWWAAFTPRDRILDAGCGVGVVALALACCRGARDVTGVELQPELAAFARENVRANGAADRVKIIEADLRRLPDGLRGGFDVVCANPPYREAGAGRVNAAAPRAAGRHELTLTLDELVAAAASALKPGGRLFLIHQPRRLDDLFRTFSAQRLSMERLRFVHPRAGEEANLVLVAARAGGAADAVVLPPLIVYKAGQEYGDEVAAVYAGEGKPLGGAA